MKKVLFNHMTESEIILLQRSIHYLNQLMQHYGVYIQESLHKREEESDYPLIKAMNDFEEIDRIIDQFKTYLKDNGVYTLEGE